MVGVVLGAAICSVGADSSSSVPHIKYSPRIVNTTSGQLRGVLVSPQGRGLEVVEAFLGVPYAAPPVGKLRYRFPAPAPRWRGVRVASTLAPACPQRLPDLRNRTAALERMPPGRLAQLERLLPLLREANQSEDCLALNIYVPAAVIRGREGRYPVVVWLHGESFEFGAGSLYDGSVLASVGRLVVITINYRLGVLGFLRTGPGLEGAGLLGARDVGVALRWIRANVAELGGDPHRVTLMGHHTGAALANLALLDPTLKGLVHRAVLLSGSALSPWAVQLDSERIAASVARQVGCQPPSSAVSSSSSLECLEKVPLESLMGVVLPEPAFLPRIGPPSPRLLLGGIDPETAMRDRGGHVFFTVPLLMGFTSSEVVSELGAHELQWGVEEERRAQLVRTFVRNAFAWHVTEIAAAVLNEYTDWARAVQHPISLRDNTLEALGDGLTVAPLLRVAKLHARRGAPTFLYHFAYQAKDADYPQRIGSARGDDVAYLLGAPLVSGGRLRDLFPHNFTRQDQAVSSTLLACLANFAKSGDPNVPEHSTLFEESDRERVRGGASLWPTFDVAGQAYLSISAKVRARSHYHAHRMATWLFLVPQLHRPDRDEVSPRHHTFVQTIDEDDEEESVPLYAGEIRAEPFLPRPGVYLEGNEEYNDYLVECSVVENGSQTASASTMQVDVSGSDEASELLHRDSKPGGGQGSWFPPSWPVALAMCLGAGCLLLLLNILVFAAFMYHRERQEDAKRKEAELELKVVACSSSSGGGSSAMIQNLPILTSSPRPCKRAPPRSCCPPSTSSTTTPVSVLKQPQSKAPVKKRVTIQEISV